LLHIKKRKAFHFTLQNRLLRKWVQNYKYKKQSQKETVLSRQKRNFTKICIQKKDLLSLCYSNLIPEQYHYFYEKLLTDNATVLKPIHKYQKEKKSTKKTTKTKNQTPKKKKNIKQKSGKKLFK